MAVNTNVPDDLKNDLKTRMLQSGISNESGIEAFRRILGRRAEHQVAIFPYDLQATLEAGRGSDDDETREPSVTLHAPSAKAVATAHPRPPLQTPYVAARTETETKICKVWQELLGIDQVGIQDNFFDLGGHSLLAVRVMSRVNEELGSDIPVARLYEGLTAAFLATVVADVPLDRSPDNQLDEDAQRRERARSMKENQQQRRRVSMRR